MSARAVWKFELQPGVTVIEWPDGSKPLTVAAQDGGVFLWALVYAELVYPVERRAFLVVGTGHRHEEDRLGDYIGTAFLGPLVFHAFETPLP